VKNSAASAKKLSALLKKIGPAAAPAFPPPPAPAPAAVALVGDSGPVAAPELTRSTGPNGIEPVAGLVRSMLLWESTTEKAIAAYARMMEHVVDYNDLRVCMPQETIEHIGPRYPRALDRCQRLRAVLRNVYLREHAVNLHRLSTMSKREVKKYVETLEGIVPYVAARVLLLCYDVHVMPVDDQLRIQLIDADIVDASVEIPELSNWLTLQIKPADGAAAQYALQAWVDSLSGDKKSAPKKTVAVRRGAGKRESRRGVRAAAS
jgi:hypothetical protein